MSLMSHFYEKFTQRSSERNAKNRQNELAMRKKRRLRVESLENRNLMAGVVFDSVIGFGDDDNISTAFAVAADQVGNSFVTGRFNGTVDFDLSSSRLGDGDILTARGISDLFVAKYAPDNSLVWVVQMGGDLTVSPWGGTSTLTDTGRSIEVDANGSVFVAGEFGGIASFGSQSLTSSGSLDSFVAKLTGDGVVQWARRLGTSSFDVSGGLGLDNSGNVITHSISTTDLVDIRKFNPTGGQVWQKSLTVNGANLGETTVDGAGNVYLAGNFSGTVDFDPSSKTKFVSSGPSSSGFIAYIMSLDANGNFRWVSPFKSIPDSTGSYGSSTVASLEVDSNNGLYVGGGYSKLIDFQVTSQVVTLPTSRGGGAYIAKLNSSNGQLAWARALESDQGATVNDMDVDALGNVYATGWYRGTADFDPSSGTDLRTPVGDFDIFVVKLNGSGSLSWTETIGGAGADMAMGIAVDGKGDLFLAGYIIGTTTDFDPDPLGTSELTAGVNKSKAFRLKLRQV